MFIVYIFAAEAALYFPFYMSLCKGSILTNRPLIINILTNSRFPGQGEQSELPFAFACLYKDIFYNKRTRMHARNDQYV